VNEDVIEKMDIIKEKVYALETFEQILVEEMGYQAETYGKVRTILDSDWISISTSV